jgi:5-methylcytosine-specific restriction protein A
MFEIGKVYRRADLHAEFKGQEQGGILTPGKFPLIFLITGEAGLGYGYHDEALRRGPGRAHGFRAREPCRPRPRCERRGRPSVREGSTRGQLRYRGHYVCSGYQFVDGVPDANDEPRRAIAFELAPIEEDGADENRASADVAGLMLARLRALALEAPPAGADPKDAKHKTYRRCSRARVRTSSRQRHLRGL